MKAALVPKAFRFVVGARKTLRTKPATLEGVKARLRDELATREPRFLRHLDDLVWSVPSSPYHRLFEVGGIERGDVVKLVGASGLDGALVELRDAGVFVSYGEWSGTEPVRRGSTTFDVRPQDFFNPRVRADYMGSTGASRSGGTPVATSFVQLRDSVFRFVLRYAVWDVAGVPRAIWFPVLPSSVGVNTILRTSGIGAPIERWFSQVDPGIKDVPLEKRLTNMLLPLVGWSAGMRLPRPELAHPSDPSVVLEWCLEALSRERRVLLSSYASSAVRLARLAADRHVRLDGLVVILTGEPLTQGKAEAIRAVGGEPANTYGFMQKGGAALSCPHLPDEQLHVLENDLALITRPVTRPDGATIDAFLWTTIAPVARSVFINVENDDYGVVRRDVACACEMGDLGLRTLVSNIRGISKVVAGGITVPGEVLLDLAEQVLPREIGGGPSDYQFAEQEGAGGSILVLRIDPAVPGVDETRVVEAVRKRLRRTEVGLLADEVWRGGSLRVVRAVPHTTRSGKILAFEGLSPPE